ncbi:MAG TPA: DUF6624 domain-containing protein [Puia sp.]|nr:DUF6624 domain-containing protein [Puia sp.]
MIQLVPLLISAAMLMQGDTLPAAALTPAERDSIVKVLFTVDDDDQKYRVQLSEVEQKKPVDSMVVRVINVKIREADSINLIKVKAIVDKYSWLGVDVIGDQCNTALFMVIQHADPPVREKYLPVIREAVKEGRAQPRHLAMLEDRVAIYWGRKQRYGTQLRWDLRVNAFRLAPLEDPDHVDERRRSVGLPPLAVYLAQWGLSWDVEQYKKELSP